MVNILFIMCNTYSHNYYYYIIYYVLLHFNYCQIVFAD